VKTFSIESELCAIASICDGADVVRATLQAALTDQHFAGEETGELYVRLGSFGHQNRPIPSLKTLRLDPALSDNAREMLEVHTVAVGTTEEAAALVDQLEQYRKLRVIYNGARDVVDSIREPSPQSIQGAIDALEGIIIGARSQYEAAQLVTAGRGENAGHVIAQVLSQTKPDRIITGFRRFDEASGGFARKDLVLVAATTGGGKSVMANQLGINAYLGQNRNVALVSFEMDEEEIYARILASLTDIDFGKIYLRRLSFKQVLRCQRAWETFTEHGKRNGCRFSIWCPSFDVTPAAVGAMLKPGNFDEILIDYVGLVDGDQKKALHENLGMITRGFKAVARNQNNVVIVMAQLDEESNKVKYSKAMRHHSSYVWKWKCDAEQEETGEVTVDMEKARHCRAFNFDLYANFSIMAFTDKDGSETGRQCIDRLAAEYGVEAIDPQTGEVQEVEEPLPEPEPESKPEPPVVEPVPEPEPTPPPSRAQCAYASLLDQQLRAVSITVDEDDL
jgi:replicative DNA helicase